MKWLMYALQIRSLLLAPLVLLLFIVACSAPEPTSTPLATVPPSVLTAETASYAIEVKIGPTVTPDAMGSMAVMTIVDRGQPVNRHLEVHVLDKASGAKVKNLIPKVTLTDQATGTSQGLPDVQACLLANHRVTEPHFGDNLYLPNGKYTVTVGIGSEAAVLQVSL